jgi:hypothetical protein
LIRNDAAEQRPQDAGDSENGRDDGNVGWILGWRDHEWCHHGDKGVNAGSADALDRPEDDPGRVSISNLIVTLKLPTYNCNILLETPHAIEKVAKSMTVQRIRSFVPKISLSFA